MSEINNVYFLSTAFAFVSCGLTKNPDWIAGVTWGKILTRHICDSFCCCEYDPWYDQRKHVYFVLFICCEFTHGQALNRGESTM